MNITSSRCQRPGCSFARRTAANKDGTMRRRRGCSPVCEIWLSKARRTAASSGPEAEAKARALLRLSDLLDARTYATELVPEFFETLDA